ncbi:hypothetical protein AWM70_03635 [Paenibacillus yonginensis]|uniref:Uncharacterized protein n=1 Tax=Paenibacillus yonginensis TaxID=1462996 RepID=A0A1B1MX69_9BACL|nr:hypothetical protein [Paenibacillus yonginensis]ANS73774.1 hypothetical protein AWM70_03635 [Paenibacillus yonginensis]
MKEFRILKLLDKIRVPLEKTGVQYPELRLILQVKLTMDGRRVPTVGANMFSRGRERDLDRRLSGNGSAEEAGSGNRFIRSLWLYALIGLVLLPFILMGDNYLFQMSVIFSILFFMVTSSLISDFSSVLLDIRDKTILVSKPVNAKTINLAKMIHILIYLFYITAAVTVPSLLAAVFKHGIGFLLLYLAEIILMDFFIVALTALLYFLVLRFFNGEVLKDIINYVQIGLTIVLTVGYQLVFRLFNLSSGLAVHFEPKIWQYFLPPVWFAGAFEVLFNGKHAEIYLSFALLALLVPILSLAVYTLLMPRFEQHLQKLSEQGEGGRRKTSRFYRRIGSWVCRTKQEAVFFDFASIMLGRERDFKLKVYPSLGLSIVFPFIFLITNFRTGSSWAEISSGQSYLFIYLCTIMVPTVVMTLKYSGNYKGAWIYKTVPLGQTKDIFKGTLKAFLVRLLLPLFLVEAIIFTAIFGVRILPDLLVVLLVLFLFTYISFKRIGGELPFSREFETVPEEGAGFKTLGLLLILGGFALLHYLSLKLNYGIYGYLLILFAVNLRAWRKGFED